MWLWAYIECKDTGLPPLIQNYVSLTLRDSKMDEFTNHEQGNKFVAAYEDKFHFLSQHSSYLLLNTKREQIFHFIKELNTHLQMKYFGKTFQKMGDFVKKVEGVRQYIYVKSLGKNAHNVGNLIFSYC